MKNDFHPKGLALLATLATNTLERAKKEQATPNIVFNECETTINSQIFFETDQLETGSSREPTKKRLEEKPTGKSHILPGTGFNWIMERIDKLLAAGWTRPELFRRNRSRGIAWLVIWEEKTAIPSLGGSGEIIFTIKRRGRTVIQTAWPQAKAPPRL